MSRKRGITNHCMLERTNNMNYLYNKKNKLFIFTANDFSINKLEQYRKCRIDKFLLFFTYIHCCCCWKYKLCLGSSLCRLFQCTVCASAAIHKLMLQQQCNVMDIEMRNNEQYQYNKAYWNEKRTELKRTVFRLCIFFVHFRLAPFSYWIWHLVEIKKSP